MATADAENTVNLTLLLPPTSTTVSIPSADSVATLLQGRLRKERFATYIGASTLVHVNPLQPTQDASEDQARQYREDYDVSGNQGAPLQPHLYDLASRAYLAMRRTGKTQGIAYTGLSGSGKSTAMRLLTYQLIRLSQSSRALSRPTKDGLVEQLPHLFTLLEAFTQAKTSQNVTASRTSQVLEMHFDPRGSLVAAKVLVFGLDRSRLRNPLGSDERTMNVFYQLLAGLSPKERTEYALFDDPFQYDLLASSGSHTIASNPDGDSIAFEDLRVAFKALGFKSKHVASVFRILSAILMLGNLDFDNHESRDFQDQSAFVSNRAALDAASSLLGVTATDLERTLTNKVQTVRKETLNVLLSPDGARRQRDDLMVALFDILVSYVFETANHKLFPGDDVMADLQAQGATSILQLDTPGLQGRNEQLESQDIKANRNSTLLEQADRFGASKYEDFLANYQTELLQAWLGRTFFSEDDSKAAQDGVVLPRVDFADLASARLELLRGGVLGGRADTKPGGILGGLAKTGSSQRKGKYALNEDADNDFLDGMRGHFASHQGFISRPSNSTSQSVFGVAHWASPVSYDVAGFVASDLGLLDVEFVNIMRHSQDTFVARLFGGPSMALEFHPLDDSVVIAAQVSAVPLRRLSPLNPAYPFASDDMDTTEPLLDPSMVTSTASQINATLSQIISHMSTTRLWNVICLRPNDSMQTGMWDSVRVQAQLHAMAIPELIARKRADYIADWDVTSFCMRYQVPGNDVSEVHAFLSQFGWSDNHEYTVGRSRVWLSFVAFRHLEDRLRSEERDEPLSPTRGTGYATGVSVSDSIGVLPSLNEGYGDLGTTAFPESQDDLIGKGRYDASPRIPSSPDIFSKQQAMSPTVPYGQAPGYNDVGASHAWGGSEWGGEKRKDGIALSSKEAAFVDQGKTAQTMEEVESSNVRRYWVYVVYIMTFWIPSFMISSFGRIKRPDQQLAWREKVAICQLILLLCGIVVFYILVFGNLLCPDKDKVWNTKELSFHGTETDYYVAVRGKVYDITRFYRGQHSDILGQSVDTISMLTLAGQDLSNYFPVPLNVGCPNVQLQTLNLQYANWSATLPTAVHATGIQQASTTSALHDQNWYPERFLPFMQNYYKGRYVFSRDTIRKQAGDGTKKWALFEGGLYDLTDYLYTLTNLNGAADYTFIDPKISALFDQNPGGDLTKDIQRLGLDPTVLSASTTCMKNLFYLGETDFRELPKCLVQNYLLLAFTCLIAATILIKFLAALQLGSKKMPELRDKFVICQVPCYTEGEESLRKTIDSLATIKYDDKRKLIFVICDGMIIGSGNDRSTPRIVLDILGVDPDIDPDPLLFQSVSEGSKQLNYGKVYSGLYEVDGHVVPYIVVVKVGKPSERSKPGNRGKRDSQIMLMRFLNRVHFDSPMNPLELEICHQIKNVIGVEPQLYEFLFTVDADTEVNPDSLNRLVAASADDGRVIGICGETKLSNEKKTWWTMIQVYEYYISHHLSKAFESLFGSVTCLPGCFTLYRIRSADKGRPLVVSSLVIDDYSEIHVDTLHKKNLFSLGEDRYFTTLLLKHFPYYKTKFTPDAVAVTAAPETWAILLSQRRRWINSTVHNLAELLFLKDLCGFCCFSMRFFVFNDLLGTLILPATFVYLVYLVVEVATKQTSIPTISLAILGATYGCQAVIFLLKREWSLIFWLIIYLIAYPVWSFFLPLYSFWHMDDFSWGNTRVVVGEGKHKKVLADTEDEGFDLSMIPLRKFADYQAAAWNEEAKSLGIPPRPASVGGFSLASRHVPQPSKSPSYMGGGARSISGAEFPHDNMMPHPASHSRLASYASGLNNFPGMMGPQPMHPHMYPGSFGRVGGMNDMSAFQPQHGFRPSMGQMPTHQSMMSLGGMSGGFHAPTPMPSSMDLMGASGWVMMPGYPSMMSMGDLHGRNMSMFSLPGAGQMQPVAASRTNPTVNPTDDELTFAIRSYLSTQDLMKVTKRTVRDAIAQFFPNADLTEKKAFINDRIDSILAGQ